MRCPILECKNKIGMQKRMHSVIGKTEDLEHLYTIENFPIYMGVTDCSNESDIFADMKFVIGKKTGMIQLGELVPEDVLYAETHNSSFGKVWEDHHHEFADFISSYMPESVLEVGGGNGRLALYYMEKHPFTNWIINEPSNAVPLMGVRASYIRGFFKNKIEEIARSEYDVIVHSHLLEHIYEPNSFLGLCSSILKENQYMCFSIPNLRAQLEKKYSNALNFEHTYYLTEPYIYWMLSHNSFEVIEKKYFMDDHSIFFSCKKSSSVQPISMDKGLYQTNKKVFYDYISYYTNLVNRINRYISKHENVFLFGAHIFSQNLICFGLDTSCINMILDNDPLKQNKRMYGTNLNVESPEVLKSIKDPIVILKCGSYNNEIKENILKYINHGTEFVE